MLQTNNSRIINSIFDTFEVLLENDINLDYKILGFMQN
jgi:hypothetical protein